MLFDYCVCVNKVRNDNTIIGSESMEGEVGEWPKMLGPGKSTKICSGVWRQFFPKKEARFSTKLIFFVYRSASRFQYIMSAKRKKRRIISDFYT